MKSAPAKRNLYQQLEDVLSAPFVALKDDDPLVLEVARLSAAGPRRGLQVFQGGATTKPTQELPPLRRRRTLNFGG
jgi:hypothetical protein